MSERSLVEMLDRVRAEREEAWERASLFARHADRLEIGIRFMIAHVCRDDTAEQLESLLKKENSIFNKEWNALKENQI